jgi:hypothetical protein
MNIYNYKADDSIIQIKIEGDKFRTDPYYSIEIKLTAVSFLSIIPPPAALSPHLYPQRKQAVHTNVMPWKWYGPGPRV